jgi:uncharacterized protein (DUF1778 family)
MKSEPKNTMIAFRTTESLKKKLEVAAAKDNRSLSDYIHLLLYKATK